MTTEIRLAQEGDIGALIKMNEEFNGVTVKRDRISLGCAGEIVAVAFFGGMPAAFGCAQVFKSFCYESPQGEITELYVRPAFRRQGLATRLVRFLEHRMLGLGAHEIKILTGKDNDAAQSAYVKLGYVRKDETIFGKRLQRCTGDVYEQ